jgi:hypothetical protein
MKKVTKKQPLKAIEKPRDQSPMKLTKSNVRSKSASTVSNPVKIILPPMQTLHESSSHSSMIKTFKSQIVPELPLRLVQSAPTLSQSVNLPPLLSFPTSPNKKKTQQSVDSKLHLTKNIHQPNKLHRKMNLPIGQRRPSFEEHEQEGGILAPRR